MEIELNKELFRKPTALLLSCALATSLCPVFPQFAYADECESPEGNEAVSIEAEEDEAIQEGLEAAQESDAVQEEQPSSSEVSTNDEVSDGVSSNDQVAQESNLKAEGSAENAKRSSESESQGKVDESSQSGSVDQGGMRYYYEATSGGVAVKRVESLSGAVESYTIPASLVVNGEEAPIVSFAWPSSSTVTANTVVIPAGVKVVDLSGLSTAQTKELIVRSGAVLEGTGFDSGCSVASIVIESGAYVDMNLNCPTLTSVSVSEGATIIQPINEPTAMKLRAQTNSLAKNGEQQSDFTTESIKVGRVTTTYYCMEDGSHKYYFTPAESTDLSQGLVFRGVESLGGSSDSSFSIPTSVTGVLTGTVYPITKVNWSLGKTLSASEIRFPANLEYAPAGIVTGVSACSGLTSIVFEPGASVVLTGNVAATKLELSNPYSVTIGDGCTIAVKFRGSLSSLAIGSNVSFGSFTGTDNGIFAGNTSLASVSIDDTDLLSGMFSGCSGLTSFSWAKTGEKSIPANTFNGCSLTTFDFSSVKEIGASAFYGNAFKTLTIPSTVTSIGNSAFVGCAQLESLDFGASINPDAETGSWFAGCTSLKSLTLQSVVHYLPTTTFRNVPEGMTICNKSSYLVFESEGGDLSVGVLKNEDGSQVYPFVEPPEGYTLTTNYYDSNTGKLTVKSGTAVIPISFFNTSAFDVEHGGNPVQEIVIEEGNTAFVLDEQGILYTVDMKTLVKAPSNLTEATIPEGVVTIRREAFMDCNQLVKVTLPEGLQVIGDQAFKRCSSLKSINLPSSVTHIGNGAFESVVIDEFVAPESLWVGNSLTDFVEDGGVPSINSIFYGWNYGPYAISMSPTACVQSLDLSAYSSTMLPHYAFAGLGRIEEVAIPSSVRWVGSGTFYECKNIKVVYAYAPDSLVINTIGQGHGDSGSGDTNESYAITAPGAFSFWNSEIESDGLGIGSKFQDMTGIVFYGCAWNKNLQTYCESYGQTFIPIVTLQTLSGSDNPFWNKTLSSQYAVDYGEGMTDYGYVEIADIAKGGTPQVIAKFGQYSGTRDLTDDAACTIVYYGPDGSKVTSFDEEGEYTASLVGDSKSVFGSRQIKFYVGERPQEQTEPAGEADGSSAAKTDESGAAKADGETKASEGAPAATPAATRASGVVYQTVYASGAAVQSVTQAATNVYAVDDKTGIASALDRIAGTDSSILVWGGGTEAAPQYVWEVPGTGITAGNASGLAFGVSDASKNSSLAHLADGSDFTAFKVAQDGSFPGTYALHWKTSSTFYDGEKVNVYRVVDADGADPTLELLKANVPVVDGYVTVDVDAGGTYMLMEAIEDSSNPLAEKAYADTGVDADAVGSAEQSSTNWAAPIALTAVVAAAIGTFGGWFMRFRRRDEGGADATTGQKL